jgi:hypothetical protein
MPLEGLANIQPDGGRKCVRKFPGYFDAIVLSKVPAEGSGHKNWRYTQFDLAKTKAEPRAERLSK